MMYMGPYKIWEIPFVSLFVTITSYPVFLPTYFIGFTLVGILSSYIAGGIVKVDRRLLRRNNRT